MSQAGLWSRCHFKMLSPPSLPPQKKTIALQWLPLVALVGGDRNFKFSGKWGMDDNGWCEFLICFYLCEWMIKSEFRRLVPHKIDELFCQRTTKVKFFTPWTIWQNRHKGTILKGGVSNLYIFNFLIKEILVPKGQKQRRLFYFATSEVNNITLAASLLRSFSLRVNMLSAHIITTESRFNYETFN